VRFLGKTTRLLWAIVIAALVVPVLPVAGGRDSGELLDVLNAEASSREFDCGKHDFRAVITDQTDPYAPHHEDGFAGQITIDSWGPPTRFGEIVQYNLKLVWGLYNVIDFPDMIASGGQRSAVFNWGYNSSGDKYANSDFRASYHLFLNRDNAPWLYAETGDGIAKIGILGSVWVVDNQNPGAPPIRCGLPLTTTIVTPGFVKQDGPMDPEYGPGSTQNDLLPVTSDPSMSSHYPDPDNRHCESCDKRDDMNSEQSMFDDRDKVCEPLRYQQADYLNFRACKKSGLFAIRASESAKANAWYRWINTNKNGWRSPGDYNSQVTLTTPSDTISHQRIVYPDGHQVQTDNPYGCCTAVFAPMNNLQPSWWSYGTYPYKPESPSVQVNTTSRPPPESGWKPNPFGSSPKTVQICDYTTYSAYGCGSGPYPASPPQYSLERGVLSLMHTLFGHAIADTQDFVTDTGG
jgi:hypothetical protein